MIMVTEHDNNELQDIVSSFARSAPVSVYDLASRLDLDVVTDNSLHKNISGKIARQDGGRYRVTLNGLHSRTRRRFTLAHEIAHYVLHRDLIGNGIEEDALYRSGKTNDVEREANRYAAQILMPWQLVLGKYVPGKTTALDIAREFDVSLAVAEIRLKELQYALSML